jgi:hypothetical protein
MATAVVESVMAILKSDGPRILLRQYWEANPGKDRKTGKPLPPGWRDRLQAAAGDHKSGDDPHINGLALDIVLFADKPDEQAVADDLVSAFLTCKKALKFISLVYNGSEWNGAGQRFNRGGSAINRHVTHIHIEWGAANSNLTGFEDDLSEAVSQVSAQAAINSD